MIVSGRVLLEPKEVTIGGRPYIYSKFPAVAGREIVSMYVASGIPKVGSYETNKEMMFKLMAYVAAYPCDPKTNAKVQNAEPILLSMESLIDNHVKGFEKLMEIEAGMLAYNCDFFLSGRASTFLEDIAQKVPAWITKILTLVSQASLPAAKQP